MYVYIYIYISNFIIIYLLQDKWLQANLTHILRTRLACIAYHYQFKH